jgi:hypothetical protein
MRSSPDVPWNARPRVAVSAAFLEGWRRVLGAPALTAGLLLVTIATALPPALVVRSSIADHLGSSRAADRLLEGWDPRWAAEFGQEARGVARTLTIEVLGAAGTLAAVSAIADGMLPHPAIAATAAVYVTLWVFLSGGLLDRLARGRPVGGAAFFSASGVFFFRFLRLAAVIGSCYWVIFRWLHPFLFETLWNRWTRDLTSETAALQIRVGLYLVLAAALLAVGVLADYARVRAVVEDRRSMLGALAASIRFVRRRLWRVAGLQLLNVAAVLLIVLLWLWGDPPAGWAPWLALAIGQLYVAARIAAKLAFMASEVVFFQRELAHAHYTALPEPTWPDSPAAEAIAHDDDRQRSRA